MTSMYAAKRPSSGSAVTARSTPVPPPPQLTRPRLDAAYMSSSARAKSPVPIIPSAALPAFLRLA